MSTSTPPIENGIAAQAESITRQISGPYWEPATVPNRTLYWRYESCGYESTHEPDPYRESFYAQDCEARQ